MSENQQRKLKDIFKDYETRANIQEAYVTALNVNKKNNTLGIILHKIFFFAYRHENPIYR